MAGMVSIRRINAMRSFLSHVDLRPVPKFIPGAEFRPHTTSTKQAHSTTPTAQKLVAYVPARCVNLPKHSQFSDLGFAAIPACTAHEQGGSSTQIYADLGALELPSLVVGKAHSVWFPSTFYTLHSMDTRYFSGFPSIEQTAALIVFPRLLCNGRAAWSIVGGWSAGGIFASYLILQCEASSHGIRSSFFLDVRTVPPSKSQLSTFRGAPRLNFRGSLAISQFAEAPQLQFRSASIHFVCPVDLEHRAFFLTDDAMMERMLLYTGAGNDVWIRFPDTAHDLIGTQTAWDIARRVRRPYGAENGQ